MNLYENHILPRIIDTICGHRAFAEQRGKILPRATGRVLEVGYGSGTSLPWYDAEKIETLIALDPAEGALQLASKAEAAAPFPVEHLALRGEEIPLDAASVDTVVVAYTLCTIPAVEDALRGMRRVLKPTGRLLFVEHGRSPDPATARWQERVDRIWGAVFGGCTLVRTPPALLEHSGFRLEHREELRIERPPPIPGISLVAWNYLGVAEPV